jgi:hypothetical protein
MILLHRRITSLHHFEQALHTSVRLIPKLIASLLPGLSLVVPFRPSGGGKPLTWPTNTRMRYGQHKLAYHSYRSRETHAPVCHQRRRASLLYACENLLLFQSSSKAGYKVFSVMRILKSRRTTGHIGKHKSGKTE